MLDALHGFAGDLYGQLSRTPGNLALSPYSVAVALGMTVNGASGPTADEMRKVLRLEGSLEVEAFNGGLDTLTRAVEGLAGSFERAMMPRLSSPWTRPTPCSAIGPPRGAGRSSTRSPRRTAWGCRSSTGCTTRRRAGRW